MKIARVFPSRTRLTPIDSDAIVGRGPNLLDKYDEAHISVLFSWDIPLAEKLGDSWSKVCPVKIGGPAMDTRGEDFEPGIYVKLGAVITSRGCPNRCWFCSVWRREGNEVRELPIRDGWNVLDDNLLRCSKQHVRSVFDMLSRQERRPVLTGGLEAAALKDWHIDLLEQSRVDRMFFAYDTPDDLEPLRTAGKRLKETRLTRTHHLHAYCLVGHPKDTFDAAEQRLRECYEAGFFPMAMLYRNREGQTSEGWRSFQRVWARPAITRGILKEQNQ